MGESGTSGQEQEHFVFVVRISQIVIQTNGRLEIRVKVEQQRHEHLLSLFLSNSPAQQ